MAAMSAIFTLLLGASIERLSPLPARVKVSTEATQQQPPFRKAQPVVTVLAHSDGVSAKPSEIEPDVAPKKVLTEPIVGAELPAKEGTTIGRTQKTAVHRTRPSVYDSEADLVAPNIIVRYDPQTGARLQRGKRR